MSFTPAAPEVEHGNEPSPKWLVEPAEVYPSDRPVYSAAGGAVGQSGGFYLLILTA